MITKEQFNLWKNDPVTLAFYESVTELIGSTVEQLIGNNNETISDDYLKGAITALRDVLKTEVEDVDND